MNDFGVYVILTDPQLSYTTIAEKCVENGVKMLQLREKHLSDKELVRIGKTIRSITKGSATNFVVNDRPDIALVCEADFLHLGQTDMAIEDARKIVGDIKIGLSTHSIQQAQEAFSKRPDYIGFGPVYPTPTKSIPDNPVGIKQLKQVLNFATVPVVAIGGIFPENIEQVVNAGAKNIAMVRYFMQAMDFEKRLLKVNKWIDRSVI